MDETQAVAVQTPVTEPGPPPVPSWRAWLRRCMLVFLALFAIATLVRYHGELLSELHNLSWWAVPAALLTAVLSTTVSLGVWRALMTDLGVRLPWRASARIFYVSQLGKYLPGSVWAILTQIELSREYRIPRRTNVAVGVLVIVDAIAVGISVGALLLPFTNSAATHRFWWVALVVPFMLAALTPPVLGRMLSVVLRVTRREPLPKMPSWGGMAQVVLRQLVVWLLLGLHLWLLLVGLGVPALRALPAAIGGYALAYSLGQLALVLPAGAGVRETILVVVLSTLVPAPVALLVALFSRAILTVVDLGMAGTHQLIGHRAPAPAPGPARADA